jgi:selenoprotein W-related protein
VSAAEQILNEFGGDVASLTLIPGDGGIFDVIVDGELIYSKEETGRHAEDGEVAALVRERL